MSFIGSTERTKSLDHSLIVFDTETREPICELWEQDASIENPIFSPIAGDARLVCTSSKSGFDRPLIWNIDTDERLPLQLNEIPGTILPHAWSDDASQILLCQVYQAQYQLYRYEPATQTVTKLDHPVGSLGMFVGGYFAPEGEIWVTWEDSAHPSRLERVRPVRPPHRRAAGAGLHGPGGGWRGRPSSVVTPFILRVCP